MAGRNKIRRAIREAFDGIVPQAFVGQNGQQLPASIVASGGTLTIEAGADARKRFTMLAYSGGPLTLREYDSPVVVDLQGISIEAGGKLPVPFNHNLADQIGEAEARITPSGIEASGYIDSATENGKLVTAAGKGGLDWEASIGAPVQAMEFYKPGEKVTVNGREFSGPVYVARKTTLKEISIVRRGADVGQTRVAIAAALDKGKQMNEFETWLKASGFDPATMPETQKTGLQTLFERTKTVQTPPVQATVTHSNDLKDLGKRMLAAFQIQAALEGYPEIAKEAIGDDGEIKAGWDMARVKKEIARENELKALRASRVQGPFIATGSGCAEVDPSKVIEAALCVRAGIGEKHLGKWFDQKTLNEAMAGRNRNASISTAMFATIQAAGLHCSPGSITDETVDIAARADRLVRSRTPDIRADGFTSLSMSNLLSNLANKSMIASYDAVEVTWPMFCGVRSHNDFKVHTRVRVDSTGAFKKVSAAGELKHVGLTDAAYTNQLDTYGAIISLTRQMQINDDLGGFLQLPQFLGRMSALRIEEAAYVLLLSNPSSFFSSGNANYMSGGSSALSITSLTTAEQKFADMVDSNGKPILISPKSILTGTAIKTTAENLFAEKLLIASSLGSTSSKVVEPARNPHAGKYPPISSPYINNTSIKDQDGAAITGQSSTAWFLFADPAVRCAIAVAFLNGNRVPTIQSSEAEFSTLGMQWRAFHDFGVGMEDPVAMVMSAGA